MSYNLKSYYNNEWNKFSKEVQHRDGYKCLKCGRSKPEVTLQTHHKIYKPGVAPWEYPLSDCLTLCKGCHAREHGIIEPDEGWTLVSIEDLGDLIGKCERNGCGTDIRYEHVTYHPLWGYKSVGSTCVQHLTMEDRYKSEEVIKLFNRISDFLRKTVWEKRTSKRGKEYIQATYKHHKINIYGKENYYSFNIGLKRHGERWLDYNDLIKTKNKSLDRVKEQAYIVLRGLISTDKSEIKLLRNVYIRIR